ncbi:MULTISPECIES: glutathione synthase [Crocosphaera]|uniref:Glutathione synthetase n=3 Tax=Crocosphaera watsonii TaxID=263511 RepID=T2JV45_CROWT|nr:MULTISPECIES: glutathione synthase [Crocosphaera]EHJ14008.1 Glutathione synthetase [Crocosphaera watsonii WH 0003]MCH2246855.1 glutathione synthase [Crocosphaera sp.]NQZ63135.1 glutathione synthase [Crocosphaera sp.]CCQ59560.1 Glutathione synthetase [Crocosphaera watsonii WH 0005]CCQ68502.1 Glutathione synthetase [Crocosphaera watsonii WH 0402]
MKLAFIIDPIAKLDPGHDSTVAMMEAAQILGHEVWITEVHQLSVIDGKALAILSQVQLVPVTLKEGKWLSVPQWYELSSPELRCLEDMDAVFMRKDPPVTIRYLYATYILELINPEKTLVINSPQGLREANEKMYTLQFYSVMPETVVSQDKDIIRRFVEEKKQAVLKPLGGKAGEGILFLETGDRNFNSIIEVSTHQGQEPVMIQRFLPEAKNGDKRIILLDGKPIGAVNRVPTGQEFRGNMAVGGRVEKAELTPREDNICEIVGPQLSENGLYFVGIDVIGGYLTEVNVTSPTGIREIDLLDSKNLGQEVIQWLSKVRLKG